MTGLYLADAIHRYRQRLVRTGAPAFAAEAAPDPPEHIEVRSDALGSVMAIRNHVVLWQGGELAGERAVEPVRWKCQTGRFCPDAPNDS